MTTPRPRRLAGPGRPALAALVALGVAVGAAAQEGTRVAVLPFENVSGDVRALAIVMPLVERALRERGWDVVAPERLEPFLFRHQVRPTSQLNRRQLEALRAELGVGLALVGSVGLYNDSPANPQWGLAARILSTADGAILWARSAGLTGEESTIALGLGTITSGERLAARTVERLLREVPAAGQEFPQPAPRFPGVAQKIPVPSQVLGFPIPFGFKAAFRSPALDEAPPRRVAVLPFENRSERRGAAKIVTDVVVSVLFARGRFDVIEPGVVAEALTALGVAPFGEIDQPTLEGLRRRIAADAVLLGTVYAYSEGLKRGATTSPELELDARLLDAASGRILWAATHGRKGDDYELFLEFGKARSAVSLATRVVGEMLATL